MQLTKLVHLGASHFSSIFAPFINAQLLSPLCGVIRRKVTSASRNKKKKLQLCWHNFSLSSSLTRASGSKSLSLLLSSSWQRFQSLSAESPPNTKKPWMFSLFRLSHTHPCQGWYALQRALDLSPVISLDSLVWCLSLRQSVWFHSLITANLRERGQC